MDFKKQVMDDLKILHNPTEFGESMTVYYDDKTLKLNGVLDREGTAERNRHDDDHAQGIGKTSATLYLSLEETGFIPEKGNEIGLEMSGAVRSYRIMESAEEFGEIILKLEAYDE